MTKFLYLTHLDGKIICINRDAIKAVESRGVGAFIVLHLTKHKICGFPVVESVVDVMAQIESE